MAVRILILNPLLEADGRHGDRHGPIDAEQRELEKLRLEEMQRGRTRRSAASVQREREMSLEEEMSEEESSEDLEE